MKAGKLLKKLLKFLLILWQFPQEFIGYIASRAWKKELVLLTESELQYIYGLEELLGIKIYVSSYLSHKQHPLLKHINSHSWGRRVLMSAPHDLNTLRHEARGHGKQSVYLGIFYLPVVGIWSSVFCNLWQRLFQKSWSESEQYNWYYGLDGNKWTWTESWADKLGGVKRKKRS